MKINRISRVFYNILWGFLLITTSYTLINYWNGSYNVIGEEIVKNNITETVQEIEEKTLEYYKEYYSNNDIIGSLKIEGTNIDTLIVKGNDNDYYLNHSIEKKYDVIGSIYADYRVDLNSKQINIYGHNSQVYDVIFKELENYFDKSYYDQHKYIEIWDGKNTYLYEIFSIQIITTDYEHMKVFPSDWEEHIKKLSKSIYETGITADIEDDILVLQTCNYKPLNSYLIIISKKI